MIDEWKDVMCADAVGGEASLAACGAAAGRDCRCVDDSIIRTASLTRPSYDPSILKSNHFVHPMVPPTDN